MKRAIQDSKELAFPAISICNTNPVKMSELTHSPRMEALVASWQSEKGRRRKRSKRGEYDHKYFSSKYRSHGSVVMSHL